MARVVAKIGLFTADGPCDINQEFELPEETPEQRRTLQTLLNNGVVELAPEKEEPVEEKPAARSRRSKKEVAKDESPEEAPADPSVDEDPDEA